MKTLTSPVGKFCTSAACLFLGSLSLSASDLVLQKVPALTVEQAPAYPENLARHVLGAKIEIANAPATSSLAAAPEAALLSEDPTSGYTLATGETTLLVSLPKIENIDSISFMNSAAKGEITIATSSAKLSADSPQWHVVSKEALAGNTIKAKIGPSEAKYVRLTFKVQDAGRIAAFGVFSSPTVSDFTMPRQRQFASANQPLTFGMINYNVSNVHTKARALYVSSGTEMKQANSMIDDQPATFFSFAAGDTAPTAVIDLGKACTVNRVSAIYSANKGNMEVYVLPAVPGSENTAAAALPASVKVTEKMLAGMKPVGSVTDDGSQGKASIDFPAATGRYVMLRWNPAVQQDTAFTVAEVAAFGGSTENSTVASNKRTHNDTSDGKTVADTKDMADTKEMVDSPAEGPANSPAEEAPPGEGPPPSLPQPPPFTFIPQVLPNSP